MGIVGCLIYSVILGKGVQLLRRYSRGRLPACSQVLPELRYLRTELRFFDAFWKSEIRRPRKDREEREREREKARDPVAIVAKIGKD